MNVLVLNGPNLDRLGTREPEIYGDTSHDALGELCKRTGAVLGMDVEVRQTNHEGELVEWLHEAADEEWPVVLNAAGWSHYSIAIRDAAAQLTEPLIEVHISNIHGREEFRHRSVLSDIATGVIVGLGVDGYALALRWMAKHLE